MCIPITLSISFAIPGILIYTSLEEKTHFKIGFES